MDFEDPGSPSAEPGSGSGSGAGYHALEESLRQAEEQFDRLVADVRDYAIFLLDRDGRVCSWNAGARAIKGYEARDIIGRHFAVFYPPDAVAARWPQRELELATAHGRFEDEGWRIRKDGSRFWANVVITVLRDDDGSARGFLKITRDLTERRAADDQLRRAHGELEQRVAERTAELVAANERLRSVKDALQVANARKDRFLAVLAHELRNPLAPIRTAVDLMNMLAPLDTRLEKSLSVIDRQVNHLSRLVDDLLEVSRITLGKIRVERERLDLRKLMRAVADDHDATVRAQGIEMAIEMPPDPLWINADGVRISQAIGNLVTNAIKFTEAGGRIVMRAFVEHEEIVLEVSDTGLGLAPDLIERLFEPFAQGDDSLARSAGGLGLGLALVRGLVELHSGTVAAKSPGLGQGSAFQIRLPAMHKSGADGESAPAIERPVVSRKVLVIEDNVDAGEMLQMFLLAIGHEAVLTSTGEAGVATAQSLQPDFVICDIGLADMSGHDVARRLRPLVPHAFLLALSGYGQADDRERALAAGFDRHETKPMDMQLLQRLIADPPVRPSA